MSHESTPPERYHALDSLRGFAMLLGVLLHAAVAHMDPAPPFWPVLDPDTGLAATAFVLAVHDFRMQLFFLLAGFFGGLLRYRYGLRGLLGHRFRRIAIPFALALVFIVPTIMAAFLYAELDASRARGQRAAFDPVGHYSRPDVFELVVHEEARAPVSTGGPVDAPAPPVTSPQAEAASPNGKRRQTGKSKVGTKGGKR